MKKRNIFAATIIFLTIEMASFGAQATCQNYPEVSWWGSLSHESIRQYVAVRHDGEWENYNSKWEQQLGRLKTIHLQGGAVKTPDGNKIKGPQLETYIDKVRLRIAVNLCLAKEQINKEKAGLRIALAKQAAEQEATFENIRTGTPVAGKAVAQKAGCFKCHGVTGRATHPDAPNLAGQKPKYLVRQLIAFAAAGEGMLPVDGTNFRFHSFMSEMALALSRTQMEDIAAYFSGL
ncbi:MAG: c-type cytochrome [Rhodospirillaceae bacterium]|jgi:cytochrome c553|nr:c-type cytochrome [Rhodospirillaceae bacterium]MBT5245589.1 c-type cytochrome [Rhodospirillaceae bacterium]MBT5561163.1 c-type cytochrome [Rhodospirillaceae bacterium]MBT6242857.1 c-type cytochrome [Rhodospirillaceae bacterium]MBT7136334.1 c-type cytochrome [Rhodospirillaceae bacterium]